MHSEQVENGAEIERITWMKVQPRIICLPPSLKYLLYLCKKEFIIFELNYHRICGRISWTLKHITSLFI
jgi:hypothetical protein